MPSYTIYADGSEQHSIVASSPASALKRWLDEQSYDCIEHAADEHGCSPDRIVAVSDGLPIEVVEAVSQIVEQPEIDFRQLRDLLVGDAAAVRLPISHILDNMADDLAENLQRWYETGDVDDDARDDILQAICLGMQDFQMWSAPPVVMEKSA